MMQQFKKNPKCSRVDSITMFSTVQENFRKYKTSITVPMQVQNQNAIVPVY